MNARIAVLVAAVALLPSCKKGFGGDFEGTITMHITTAVKPADIVVKTKDGKMRFDVEGGSYILYDPKANTLLAIEPSQKRYLDLDMGSPSAPQANTSADSAAIDKTGKHETIAGLDCENWIAKDPSGKRSEVCIAQGLAFFDLGAVKGGSTSTLNKELKEKKLFPLRSVEYDASGKETSRMEVTKVEKLKIDDGDFAIPKDYAKTTLPH